MSIADQTKALLTDPRLHALVDAQTARGIAKYGHTLDDYDAPQRVRVGHMVQDWIDTVQYALWSGRPGIARNLSIWLNDLIRQYPDLTTADLLRREEGDA